MIGHMVGHDCPQPGLSMRECWIAWRNRLIGDLRFQRLAARIPGLRAIARKRSAEMFDLVAGFTYSQILLAAVESGLLEILNDGPCEVEPIVQRLRMSSEAAMRLLRAAAALDLAQETAPDRWMLGQGGAVLHGNRGVQAMIRHHRLLYADLADPLALLRADRRQPSALSEFWNYGGESKAAAAYSELMEASQGAVAEQVLAAFDFKRLSSMLDVGGGSGAFVRAVATRHPSLRLGVFDLPQVLANFARPSAVDLHPGDFFSDPLPGGYEAVSLLRVLHDHDDRPALEILRKIRSALPSGGKLIVAEPMAGIKEAKRVGDAYFGLYLMAMRSGRPRTTREIGAMLDEAGFARWRSLSTGVPVVSSVIVADVIYK